VLHGPASSRGPGPGGTDQRPVRSAGSPRGTVRPRAATAYEQATGLPVRWANDDFAELVTPSCTLALGHTRTVPLFGEDAARPADNHSAIIEFRVDDVDTEYEKLKQVVSAFVQEPTTLLFRDPDGNLVNFFTPLSAGAIERFAR